MLGSHRGPLGLSPANGTVWLGLAVEEVEDGPPDAREDANTDDEAIGRLMLLLPPPTVLLMITELLLLAAGAAAPKVAKRTEQITAELNLDIL